MDPIEQHKIEQNMTYMSEVLPRMWARMYTELVEVGISENVAEKMVCSYIMGAANTNGLHP